MTVEYTKEKPEPRLGRIIVGGQAITGFTWGGANIEQSMAALHTAIDNGITSFDTAPFYGFGLSEELIGQAIKGRRDKTYIATKIGLRWDGVPGIGFICEKHFRASNGL